MSFAKVIIPKFAFLVILKANTVEILCKIDYCQSMNSFKPIVLIWLIFNCSATFALTLLTQDELMEFLGTAEVIKIENTKLGITKPKKITLMKDGLTLRAVFKSHTEKIRFTRGNNFKRVVNQADRYENDKAAYELAQLMNITMIPATVIRKINKQKGVVQLWVEDSIVKKDIYQSKSNELDVCPFKKQKSIMHVFDILIYNDDRNLGNELYTLKDCKLWMIDHSRSFRLKKKVPKYLKTKKIRMSNELADVLRQLKIDELEELLSNYISIKQIKAIIDRRNLILKIWEKNNKPNYLKE